MGGFNPQPLPLCVRHCKVIVPAGDCRLFDITHLSRITGCAVAQHCYNGDVSFLWEKWKLWPPVKSKPLNRVTHNLSGLIMSTRWTFVPNLVKKSVHGRLLGKGVKYNFLCDFFNLFKSYLFICLFFSRTNVEKRLLDGFWRAMAQKTRNRARMCLLGVIKWKIEIRIPFNPHNPKNLALNRQFPAKMMKHETPSISERAKPIEMKI